MATLAPRTCISFCYERRRVVHYPLRNTVEKTMLPPHEEAVSPSGLESEAVHHIYNNSICDASPVIIQVIINSLVC